MFDHEIEKLIVKYNSYVENFGSLEDFPELESQAKEFRKKLKEFHEDYQYGADSIIRLNELKSVANKLFALFDETRKMQDKKYEESIAYLDELIKKKTLNEIDVYIS